MAKTGRPRHGNYIGCSKPQYLHVDALVKQMVHDLAGGKTERLYLTELLAPLWDVYCKLNPRPPRYCDFCEGSSIHGCAYNCPVNTFGGNCQKGP